MLQPVGEALGALGRHGPDRPGGDLVGDATQLALDPGLDPIGRAPDQRIQPADREVEPVDGASSGSGGRGRRYASREIN